MSTPARASRSRTRRRRRKDNPDGTMTLVEHLMELRHRVIVSLIALALGTIVGFIWYQHGFSLSVRGYELTVKSLGDILRGPYCSLPPDKRASFTADGECRLLATSPFEMLILRIKVGAVAGCIFSCPVWLYQLWAFITPGLHKKERRFTLIFVSIAVLLFLLGAVLSYVILSVGLEFLLSMGDQYQSAALTGETYFYYVIILLLVFGVSFELPLIIGALNIMGILPYSAVKNKRRIIIVCLAVLAAVVTPGQEPTSMIALTACLSLLTEISFQFCRINDKRRGEERPEWMDLDDEESSPLNESPSPISQPQAVARPGSISSPKSTGKNYGSSSGTDFSDVL
ncbi:twin-arginine translocase subunit TatC [Corynebacterium uropygiale]|uniref:Sec-independent protein translocase protein TatC n=1 Tax=Corynebacterium uropygiale TaxID=1775911 RepID=A0A9X1QRY1_9CORY|nr:twin-arginine translocase subunit TatC [Corynebacterium uropygiale]MCF4006658.1 twin-arginine translocase subunit TatC [Corynebacterium uropygiale]